MFEKFLEKVPEIPKEIKKPSIDISKSPLLEEAKSMKNKEMDISKLDEPVVREMWKPLEEIDKKGLKDLGMSDNLIEKCSKDEVNDTVRMKTINESLDGKTHPETGILYGEKMIELGDYKIVGVFPKFKEIYKTGLSEGSLKASDNIQFKECNKNLLDDIKKDNSFKNIFNKEQIEQIESGYTPRGYTWHHNEEIGKMSLIKTSDHNKTAHTGGKAIWGGGSENR